MKVDHYGISIETNTLIYVIIGGFLIALIGGLVTFHRRDWA
jgi:LPXTG-motif cell wall-anchored protein